MTVNVITNAIHEKMQAPIAQLCFNGTIKETMQGIRNPSDINPEENVKNRKASFSETFVPKVADGSFRDQKSRAKNNNAGNPIEPHSKRSLIVSDFSYTSLAN